MSGKLSTKKTCLAMLSMPKLFDSEMHHKSSLRDITRLRGRWERVYAKLDIVRNSLKTKVENGRIVRTEISTGCGSLSEVFLES